jgi:hypothetical protein
MSTVQPELRAPAARETVIHVPVSFVKTITKVVREPARTRWGRSGRTEMIRRHSRDPFSARASDSERLRFHGKRNVSREALRILINCLRLIPVPIVGRIFFRDERQSPGFMNNPV